MKVGIDIGGTTIAVGMLDNNNIIVKKTIIKTRISDGINHVINRLNDTIQYIIDQTEVDLNKISHFGIGCAGMLDRSTGEILYSNNFGWENVPLKDKIQKRFPLPIYIENDANCAAIGEYTVGVGEKYKSMVMITFGTGIGGGIILNDALFKGNDGFSNFVGHLLISANGEPCYCGRKGCWEAYASVNALIREAGKIAKQNSDSQLKNIRDRDGELNGKNIFEAINLKDRAACELFDKYIHYMAEGITDIVNILNPQAIVIGGGISEQGDTILKPLREIVLENIYCGKTTMPIIRVSSMGNDAGIVGAACLDKYQD